MLTVRSQINLIVCMIAMLNNANVNCKMRRMRIMVMRENDNGQKSMMMIGGGANNGMSNSGGGDDYGSQIIEDYMNRGNNGGNRNNYQGNNNGHGNNNGNSNKNVGYTNQGNNHPNGQTCHSGCNDANNQNKYNSQELQKNMVIAMAKAVSGMGSVDAGGLITKEQLMMVLMNSGASDPAPVIMNMRSTAMPNSMKPVMESAKLIGNSMSGRSPAVYAATGMQMQENGRPNMMPPLMTTPSRPVMIAGSMNNYGSPMIAAMMPGEVPQIMANTEAMIPVMPLMNMPTLCMPAIGDMKMNGMNDCIIMIDTCTPNIANIPSTMQW